MSSGSGAIDFAAFRYAGSATLKRPLVASTLPRARARTIAATADESVRAPFIAQDGGGWRERYASVSDAAFIAREPCNQHTERPLRCLLIGHNPSDHSWASGIGYSNPSNRFWSLLRESGVIPASYRPGASVRTLCNSMPSELGIGITDFLLEPGSDAQAFGALRMRAARDGMYDRISAHARRAGSPPRLVAFIGKRQWGHCFRPTLTKVSSGAQTSLPPGWPYAPDASTVYALTSPSGRAAVPLGVRLAEYAELAQAIHAMPWPLEPAREANDDTAGDAPAGVDSGASPRLAD